VSKAEFEVEETLKRVNEGRRKNIRVACPGHLTKKRQKSEVGREMGVAVGWRLLKMGRGKVIF